MPAALKFRDLATGAFAFTVAWAWNDAVKESIRGLYPNKSSAHATLVYAIVITMIVIFIVAIINICAHHVTNARRALMGSASQFGGPSVVNATREPLILMSA
jgi:hypothetical protein